MTLISEQKFSKVPSLMLSERIYVFV